MIWVVMMEIKTYLGVDEVEGVMKTSELLDPRHSSVLDP